MVIWSVDQKCNPIPRQPQPFVQGWSREMNGTSPAAKVYICSCILPALRCRIIDIGKAVGDSRKQFVSSLWSTQSLSWMLTSVLDHPTGKDILLASHLHSSPPPRGRIQYPWRLCQDSDLALYCLQDQVICAFSRVWDCIGIQGVLNCAYSCP